MKERKKALLSFKIENTEPGKTRNPVNPGILQPKITLNRDDEAVDDDSACEALPSTLSDIGGLHHPSPRISILSPVGFTCCTTASALICPSWTRK
jgi:hypothetical protein